MSPGDRYGDRHRDRYGDRGRSRWKPHPKATFHGTDGATITVCRTATIDGDIRDIRVTGDIRDTGDTTATVHGENTVDGTRLKPHPNEAITVESVARPTVKTVAGPLTAANGL